MNANNDDNNDNDNDDSNILNSDNNNNDSTNYNVGTDSNNDNVGTDSNAIGRSRAARGSPRRRGQGLGLPGAALRLVTDEIGTPDLNWSPR